MPRRRFTDAKGVEWEVYDVVVRPGPSLRHPAHSQQLQPAKAWLVFESARERRRLAPFPIGWDEAPPEELARFLGMATQVSISVRKPE
jgi:hypothetical protein